MTIAIGFGETVCYPSCVTGCQKLCEQVEHQELFPKKKEEQDMTLKVIKLYQVLDSKEVIDAPCCGTRQWSCSCTNCPKKPREEKVWEKYRLIKIGTMTVKDK